MREKELIDKAKENIRNHEVIKEMFEKWDVPDFAFDYIPICFWDDLDVTAKTSHGIIYLNREKLGNGPLDKIEHYLVHEITHFCQQCFGKKATQGADDGNYLENPFEIEGFQNQSEYISDTQGDEEAIEYIEDVLDHHDEKGKERKEKLKDLLRLAE